MDEKDVERESEMSKVGVALKEYFPTFGDGNVRSVFPGIDGNGNSRSPLAWRGLLFAGRGSILGKELLMELKNLVIMEQIDKERKAINSKTTVKVSEAFASIYYF